MVSMVMRGRFQESVRPLSSSLTGRKTRRRSQLLARTNADAELAPSFATLAVKCTYRTASTAESLSSSVRDKADKLGDGRGSSSKSTDSEYRTLVSFRQSPATICTRRARGASSYLPMSLSAAAQMTTSGRRVQRPVRRLLSPPRSCSTSDTVQRRVFKAARTSTGSRRLSAPDAALTDKGMSTPRRAPLASPPRRLKECTCLHLVCQPRTMDASGSGSRRSWHRRPHRARLPCQRGIDRTRKLCRLVPQADGGGYST